jgi:hypothetical protein
VTISAVRKLFLITSIHPFLTYVSMTGAISFTIYNGTKERLFNDRGWSRERMLSAGASGALGGALAGSVISIGSCRE